MIPRSGYCADDMLDDVGVALPGENPTAEVRMAAIVHAYELDEEPRTFPVQNPSAGGFGITDVTRSAAAAEVRESKGVYRFRAAAL